jgi:hypothetical protein
MAIIKNTNSFVFFVYLKLKLPSEDGLSALLCLFPQLVSGQCNKSFFGLKKKKNTNNNKCLQGCGEKGIVTHCWWQCILVQPLWKTIWKLFKNLKVELPYDLKGCKLGYNSDTCTPMFIEALFTIVKLWIQPRWPSTDKWINKCGIYIHWSFIQP